MNQNRESFGSQFAAILALAGSAIGLGNIWRFPYMVGEHGGAAFIIIYIICSIFISIPIFIAETTIGRAARKSTVGSVRKLAPGSRWDLAGMFVALAPIIIVSYYSVVGGWSIDYFVRSLTGRMGMENAAEAGILFGKVSSSVWEAIVAHTIFLSISAYILIKGVKKGIEKFTKIAIPMLFVLMVAILIYSVNLPGAGEGIRYLVHPDFSKINGKTVAYALGQSFFSMSLGVGAVLTYASYMRKEDRIVQSGIWTAVFDTCFALIAGFAIMPAVFAAGMKPEAGPSLVFGTLPYIFSSMQSISPVISVGVPILFFFSIMIAALTSEISLMEPCVSFFIEEAKCSRKKAVLIVFGICWVLGIFCSLSFGPLSSFKLLGKNIFSFCDELSSNYLMVLGSLLLSLFVGWKMDRKLVEKEMNSKLFKPLYFMIKYVAPPAILIIFITNLIF